MQMSWEDYCWIYDAVSHDQASSVGAAYAKLIKYRKLVVGEGSLTIKVDPPVTVYSAKEFDSWVQNTFPVFCSDPLPTVFNKP